MVRVSSKCGPARVVHLVTTLDIGGLEMVVLHLVRHCDRAVFEPYVFCLDAAGELAPRFEALGVPVETIGGPKQTAFGRMARLVRRLRQLAPQVLHTHNPTPHYFGTLAAYLARVPVLIHTKHGLNRPEIPRMVALNRLASNLSHCVVPVSASAAAVARRIERVPARKLRVIRNGIDLADFSATRNGGHTGRRVIHVARLNIIKDQKTLLHAARLVADAEPDFRLDILGDGPEREALVALRDELRLQEHVRLLGMREDVNVLLAQSDIFVLSSLHEGLPITVLEAMASGLPVVSTRAGGTPEVVIDGVTGLLVPSASPPALAEALLTLLRRPDMAVAMGQAGRRRAEEEFDVRKVTARYEQLYRRFLDKARGFSLTS
jgi:glycosyltransferase involved in cell wall biosynthesis